MRKIEFCLISEEKRLSQSVERKFLNTNSKQFEQDKNAKFYKKNYGVNERIFVKSINKILLRCMIYVNSRVLPSTRLLDKRSSKIKTLLRNYQEDYKNCKIKHIVWTILDLKEAKSVRPGNSHVTSQPMLFPQTSYFWMDVETFIRIAATQKRTSMHLGHIWKIGKLLCTSKDFFIKSVSSGIDFYLEDNCWRTNPHVYSGEKWKTKTRPRSEMPIWTVSQRFSHFRWRKLFRELWCRRTTTADFGFPLWQVPYTKNLCLLENKVQDGGMYLFTFYYGNNAMGQKK